MKNTLFILSVSFLILFSCSSGDDDNTSDSPDENTLVLVKKIETSEGYIMDLFYNENKLKRKYFLTAQKLINGLNKNLEQHDN